MEKLSKKEVRQRDVLRLLRAGVSQQRAVEQVGVPVSSWYVWKKDESFAVLVEDAILEGKNSAVQLAAEGRDVSGDSKYDLFLRVFADNGGIQEDACKAAGLTLQEVISASNPLASVYNPKFHSLYKDAQGLLEARALDALAANIKKKGAGHTSDARFILERRRPDEFGARKTAKEEPKKPAISEEQALAVLEKILNEAAEVVH